MPTLKDLLPPPPWEGPPIPRVARTMPAKGWLTKEQAMSFPVIIQDEDTWYHGTSMKNKDDISREGLCSARRGGWAVSEAGLYFTRDYKQAQTWALDAAWRDGKFVPGIVYAVKGRDLQGLPVHLDWKVFFGGEANDILVEAPVCIKPDKLTIVDEGFYAVSRARTRVKR